MKHAIHFVAILGPNQEHVVPSDLALTLAAAFPNCDIDWEAGDEFTRENVANLEAMGIPEMMLEGARSFIGNRFVLTVAPCDITPARLSGVVSTIHRDLGDSLGFSMDPYDPPYLQTLAETLATAIDFRYHLRYDESFSVHIEPSPCTTPFEIAKRHLPIPLGDDPEIQLHQIPDWKTPFCTGLLGWLDLSNHKNKFNESTRSFESLAEYAATAADDIEKIASPHDAWIVDVPEWSHQNCMLLAQENCYTYISLPGVPKGVFGMTTKDLTSRGTSRSSSPLFKKPG